MGASFQLSQFMLHKVVYIIPRKTISMIALSIIIRRKLKCSCWKKQFEQPWTWQQKIHSSRRGQASKSLTAWPIIKSGKLFGEESPKKFCEIYKVYSQYCITEHKPMVCDYMIKN